MSIFNSITIDLSKKSSYTEHDVQDYFKKVDTLKDAINILAKGILYRLEYTEEDGVFIEEDQYKMLGDYIGWLIWSGKVQKATALIRGLLLLSNRIPFRAFVSEIELIHPISAILIKKLSSEFA